MKYQTLVVEKKDRVGLIVLNRPDHMNTFSTVLAKELNAALDELEKDGQIRAVIIKGAGKSFCAGIDITEFSGKTLLEYREWIALMEKMTLTIATMGKPVIAAVHGYAVANGTGLLAACDLAIAAEGTRIGTTAINVGLFCMGPAVPLSRCVGRKKALEMLLTGMMIDAREAERIGLVNRVVSPEDLDEAAMKLANDLAAKNSIALQMGKRAFYTMVDMEYAKALEYMNEMMAELCTTEDAKEGVDAFLNKRKPRWKER
ncbi:MAG: enoyl-CoA hydratase/isomerase family protein [Proteobacteria bacterium]|nr:enoyl-CoA hydratase/isomerase family protein [Pseudomonadota bacterium]